MEEAHERPPVTAPVSLTERVGSPNGQDDFEGKGGGANAFSFQLIQGKLQSSKRAVILAEQLFDVQLQYVWIRSALA